MAGGNPYPNTKSMLMGSNSKLTTQGELNEFEAANIADALLWLSRSGSLSLRRELPTIGALRALHRRSGKLTVETRRS
jgi:hypothetical protein